MEVILRSWGSVRTSWYSHGLAGVADCCFCVDLGVADRVVERVGTGVFTLGRRDWVVNVLLVSTCDSLVDISVQILSMISSSLRKLTSRLVGCTLTSTRWGSMSRLR